MSEISRATPSAEVNMRRARSMRAGQIVAATLSSRRANIR